MSSYDNYWYFRFKKEFLSNEAMRNMKHETNGYIFIVIYFELSSLSLETGGYIRMKKSPQTLQAKYVIDLASDIGEDPKILQAALVYFLGNKLIEITENPNTVNIHIPYVSKNIGKSSVEADKKRLQYRKQNAKLSNKNPKFEELPLPEEQMEDIPEGIHKNVILSKVEWERLKRKYADASGLVNYISQRIFEMNYDMPSHYAFAVKVGKEDRWVTVAEKIANDKIKNKGKAEQEERERILEDLWEKEHREKIEKLHNDIENGQIDGEIINLITHLKNEV